jgi:hypothetical protein
MIWTADDYQERPGLRMNAVTYAERLKVGFAWLEGQPETDEPPVRNRAPHRLPNENPKAA